MQNCRWAQTEHIQNGKCQQSQKLKNKALKSPVGVNLEAFRVSQVYTLYHGNVFLTCTAILAPYYVTTKSIVKGDHNLTPHVFSMFREAVDMFTLPHFNLHFLYLLSLTNTDCLYSAVEHHCHANLNSWSTDCVTHHKINFSSTKVLKSIIDTTEGNFHNGWAGR